MLMYQKYKILHSLTVLTYTNPFYLLFYIGVKFVLSL